MRSTQGLKVSSHRSMKNNVLFKQKGAERTLSGIFAGDRKCQTDVNSRLTMASPKLFVPLEIMDKQRRSYSLSKKKKTFRLEENRRMENMCTRLSGWRFYCRLQGLYMEMSQQSGGDFNCEYCGILQNKHTPFAKVFICTADRKLDKIKCILAKFSSPKQIINTILIHQITL